MKEANFIFNTLKVILDMSITAFGVTFTFGNIIVFFAMVGLIVAFLRLLAE